VLGLHDKVMQIKNDYEKEAFNGDLGRVVELDVEAARISVDFDGHVVRYVGKELDSLRLAYATSIHKSQGSEYPAVVIPLQTSHFPMLSRNLLYTAVTRAKRLCVLVADPRALRIALGELRRERRCTGLTERLRAGGGPALKAVSAGQVKFFFSNAASSIPLVQSGKLKAIAHTGNGRLAILPELPSVKESLAGFEAYDWNGVFVPAGTPESVVERLSTSLNAAARDPQVIAQLKALNVETRNNSPSEFRTFVEAERLKWGRLVREANIKQR